MINTGIRPKKITKKIEYPYSFMRLKDMAEKYRSDKKEGLGELNSLKMTRANTVKFIQDAELTFGIDITDSELNSVGSLLSLGQVISKKVKGSEK